jgi:hypothetical protein
LAHGGALGVLLHFAAFTSILLHIVFAADDVPLLGLAVGCAVVTRRWAPVRHLGCGGVIHCSAANFA